MAPIPQKRTKATLTLTNKASILEKLDKGFSSKRLSLDYGVAASTITYIKQHKAEILEQVCNALHGTKKKTLHKAEFSAMEDKLYAWFLEQRNRNCPVNGILLKAKAKEIFEKNPPNGNASFNASDGWLDNFKKRKGIRLLAVCGEKLSANAAAVNPFILKFQNKVAELGLCKEQIYNADETGLFYRMIPRKIFVSSQEKVAAGLKIAKERISILLCANAAGTHKITPLIIGKAKNPRCMKNFNSPVEYTNSKNAWMTGFIFRHWFQNSFVKQVREHMIENNLHQKAILLVDNCSSHPADLVASEDGQIIIMFFPPNVTSLLQPMDQNPIHVTKLLYRNSLLSTIISKPSEEIAVLLKGITVKDAILLLKSSWDQVTATVLKNAWKKLFVHMNDEDEYTEEDNVPLAVLRAALSPEYAEIMERTIELLSIIDSKVRSFLWLNQMHILPTFAVCCLLRKQLLLITSKCLCKHNDSHIVYA